jgi:2,4-dienoyl-CoA reductase-like NADH-dependent reductase (Old Yellow Enzyme family)
MTTVSYCSVSYDGRTFEHELWMRKSILPDLKKLTKTIHREGAKVSIQLGHSGYFTNKKVIGQRPMGASPKLCIYCKSFGRALSTNEIEEKVNDFVNAALMARDAGFDAVEIHAGHGYLLSQFLSPWTNKRKDEYGGSLENRLRFPTEVVKRVKNAVGTDFPVLVKMNQQDGMQGGIKLDDAIEIAKAFELAGANALIPSAGFTSKVPFLMLRGNLPVKEMTRNRKSYFDKIGLKLFGKLMVPEHPWEPMFLSEGASEIAKAVNIPVIFIGGYQKGDHIEQALEQGASFVQLGRATIQDPDFVNKLKKDETYESPCDHCNRCVAAMDAGGVYCVSNEKGFLD